MRRVANPALDRHARSDGFAAARPCESGRSTLTLCSSLFVCFFLFTALAEPQTKRLPASSIETIAGGEPASVLGTEFSFASISGLAADTDGDIYFSIQANSRVYRLSADGKVATYAGTGVNEKSLDGVSALSSRLLGPQTLAVDAALQSIFLVFRGFAIRFEPKVKVLLALGQ